MKFKKLRLETKCIHSGYEAASGEPRVFPLVQSTTYKYDTADELGDLFDLKADGYIYSRISNPTVDVLEKKIAELEGGVASVATSSGQSANILSVLTICKNGDNIIALSNLYGGTVSLFTNTLSRYGIEVRFVGISDSDKEIEKKIDKDTKLIFGETIANPGVDVLDIERFSKIAHKNNIPLIIDNTFATPILCRPIEYGADIVTHSTTKYIDGHSRALGGIVVDSGKFNWNNGKFDDLVNPDVSYHGVSFTESFKEAAYSAKARCTFVRDIGFIMAPFNAFLTLQGIETLHLRMERHSENALKVAKYLEDNESVEWVKYPKLKNSNTYELAEKYLKKGAGGIISFGVKGGVESAKKFIDSLEIVSLVTHVADSKSCVIHPASTTHRQLTKKQLEDAGIADNLIRLSVGIENVDDIIEDIEQALKYI